MIDGNEVYIFNNKDTPEDMHEYYKRIKQILVTSAKALKSDLEDYDIVGCGFWETIEKEIIALITDVGWDSRE